VPEFIELIGRVTEQIEINWQAQQFIEFALPFNKWLVGIHNHQYIQIREEIRTTLGRRSQRC